MLTAKGVEKAKAKADSYRMSDGRGLCLRIYPTGRKAWELRYRNADGKQRTVDLGDFGDGEGQRGLATARSEAQRLRDLIREGGDPRELRRRAAASDGGTTLADVAESWFRLVIADKFRRPEQVRELLDRHILPRLGDRAIADLRRGELFLAVAGIADGSGNDGRPAARVAGQVLQYLKRLFGYAVSAGILETNPAEGIKAKDVGIARAPRSRNLTFDELATFARWLWSDQCFASDSVRALLQLLLLTGARTGEALSAKWEHVDLEAGVWHIPPGDAHRRAKSTRPHVIHLSKQARAVLASVPRYENSPWVFASPLDPAKTIDEKAAARVIRRAHDTDKRKPAKDWRPTTKGRGDRSTLPSSAPLANIAEFSPHDLRRTFRSRLADLGVPPHVAEKCLNHELGGVLAVYDRGEYLPERKKALELWGRKVAALVAGDKGAVVVEFRKAQ